jgi:hypothetical protein
MVREGANLDKVTFICNLIVLHPHVSVSYIKGAENAGSVRPLRTNVSNEISSIYAIFTAQTYIFCDT